MNANFNGQNLKRRFLALKMGRVDYTHDRLTIRENGNSFQIEIIPRNSENKIYVKTVFVCMRKLDN